VDWESLSIGIIGSLIATYIFPSLRRVIDSLFSFLFNIFHRDSFNLSGTWEYTFREPSHNNPSVIAQEKEKVKVTQVGNIIWARGETENYKREFEYRLNINHNLIYGTYRKKGVKGATSGTGVIQLVVSANRDKLIGHGTWMDADSNKIESDSLEWVKIA
jgi:hypothetical protein